MNTRVSSITLALLLVINSVVIAETTTMFVREDDESSEITLYLEEGVVDDDTILRFPNAEVLDASYDVVGGADSDGNYPQDISITVNNYVWEYSGTGYGSLGMQNDFANGASTTSAVFTDEGGGESTVELYIPVNATITDAEVVLEGLSKGTGELDEPREVSKDTNAGSLSRSPSIVIDGSNTYAVWADDGDLEERTNNRYQILFNSKNSGGWGEPTLLTDSDVLYLYSEPVIRGDSDFLIAAWMASGYLEYVYSTNDGNTWSDIQTYDENQYYVYDFDLQFDSNIIHLTLELYTCADTCDDPEPTYDWRIYHTYSEDEGNTWAEILEVSDSSITTVNSYPSMDFSGDNVHITWIGETSTTSVLMYSTSDDGGDTFSNPTQLSGSENALSPAVTCDDNSNVVVAWSEGSAEDKVVKARTSSNEGSTFNTALTLSTSEDAEVFDEVVADNDGSGNFYVAWPRTDTSDYSDVVVSRSTNSGTSWNTAVEVDGINEHATRGNPAVYAESNKIGLIWLDDYDGDGASSDPDIYYSESTNDGSSWSTMTEIGADQYYEADSSIIALAYSNGYLYSAYWDEGDNDPEGDTNGNDALGADIDLFFTRSSDDGETWSDITVISNEETDGQSWDYFDYGSYYYTDYRNDIAASGNNVYAAWSNYNADSVQWEIKFSSSSNSGSSWSDPEVISSSDTSVDSFAPSLVANGNEVIVSWKEEYDGSALNSNIVVRNSENRGDSWSSIIEVTEGDGSQFYPEMSYSNERYHIVWHAQNKEGNSEYSIEYAYSEDTGDSWTRTTLRNPDATADFCWNPTISVDDDNVYVAWADDANLDGDDFYDWDVLIINSEDNGDTWSDPLLVVDSGSDNNNYYSFPAVASSDGFVYVSYQEYNTTTNDYEHRFTLSQDYGSTWSSTFPINSGNYPPNFAKMEVVIGEKAYFGYYGDHFGDDDVDYDIVIRATLEEGYPTNPTVNLDGGSSDWEWAGEFNEENSPVKWENVGDNGAAKSFSDAIADGIEYAIDNENTFVDDFGVEMAILELTVTSDTDGRVGFSSLKIEYDVALTAGAGKFTEKLNTLVDSSTDETKETKFVVTSETNGKLILKNLQIVTAEADLELKELEFSNSNPKEGGSIVLTAYVKNTGEGDATVDVQFYVDGEELPGISTIEKVASGSTETATYTWSDLPAGTHEVKAEIVDSVPEDTSQGSEDTKTKTINVQEASAIITTEFNFDGIPVQDTAIDWVLSLENEGDKYGDVIVYIYEDEEDEDNLIYQSPPTRVNVDSIKVFEGDEENGKNWIAKAGVNNFFLKIVDYDNGEVLNGDGEGENIDVNVQRYPLFSVSKIEWFDVDDNPITSFADGTVAYAKIYIKNDGSFDVTASVDVSLTKSDKRIVPTPNYGANIEFNGDSETILIINGEYPEATFNSEDQSGFTGNWVVDIKIDNIFAKNNDEQIWDSEELIFTDTSNRVLVSQPPNLELSSLTSDRVDNIGEGQAVTLSMVVINEGEAEATGDIVFKQGGSELGRTSFVVPGYDSVIVEYEYSVPGSYPTGELNLIAQIDQNTVYPPEGASIDISDDTQSLTLNVKGTSPQVKPSETSSSFAGSMLVPLTVIGVLIIGLAGAFFMYKRSQTGDDSEIEQDDPFGAMPGTSPPPPPPMPEQPPAAAPPPVPEQPIAPPPAEAPQAPPSTAAIPETPPPAPEQPPVAAPGSTVLTVAVPAGAQPGQQIQIKAPDGRVVTVAIPAGLQPGQQFQIKV